jgi:hypothetical protein
MAALLIASGARAALSAARRPSGVRNDRLGLAVPVKCWVRLRKDREFTTDIYTYIMSI